ncbi:MULTISPECIES: hypothetical protein [Borreliella]|uniref:Bbs27 protein n=1 Tax=Borreliella yangtzensis TaxID=683292 RepID=A0ABR6PBE8_9SPIR|nr:hypothetical protein [Borreliella yangtzensis]
MQKINLLMLFMFIISVSNLISYEIKKDEIIKVKTLIALDEGGDNHKLNINFPVKKEDKNKTLFEIIGIGLEYFINQIGAENIVEVKSLNHLMGFGLIVVYKEKKK